MRLFEFTDFVILMLLSVVLGGMMLVYRKKKGGLLGSISATVATEKTTSLAFSVVMSICYPIYYAWLWFWVGPKLDLPYAYYIVLIVAAFFELVFVWVPSTTGWKRQMHDFASAIVGVGMLVIPSIFLLGLQPVSAMGIASIAVFYAATLVIIILLLLPRFRKYTFAYEVIFCVVFLLATSIVGHS